METDAQIAELNAAHAVAGAVRFARGESGLPKASITSTHGAAEVYLHGAHVTAYQSAAGRAILWMSGQSVYATGKAIRGGVPVIFPWFGPRAGDPKSPAHGFARTMDWAVQSTAARADGSVDVTLTLSDTEQTRATWPHAFRLRYAVRVGAHLELTLEVQNSGRESIEFEEALHSYFATADIHETTITGLENTTYIDKVGSFAKVEQGSKSIKFVGETDRVYLNTTATCVVHEPGGVIEVAKLGSVDTVVWNPWIAKAKAMSDFGDDEWPGMVCVETCNVGDARVKLQPGAKHTMTAIIKG